MAKPAYRRLRVEERRAQLLALGVEAFGEQPYDRVSMGQIARRAGITKAALYHYFKGKRAFFEATLAEARAAVAALTEPDRALPPLEALAGSVDRYLGWIEAHPGAYRSLLRGAATTTEVREVVEEIRESTAQRILDALPVPDGAGPSGRAHRRLAVHSWLWLMDGAIADWLERRDLERVELRTFLVGALEALLVAAENAEAADGIRTHDLLHGKQTRRYRDYQQRVNRVLPSPGR